jgi:hypothetical protein
MLVMITQNFDVKGGIVNGSIGTLQKVRYYTDNKEKQHLISCIVYVEDTSDECMPLFGSHHVPVLSDAVELRFTHPYSKKSCSI